jgi:hypothetical protein
MVHIMRKIEDEEGIKVPYSSICRLLIKYNQYGNFRLDPFLKIYIFRYFFKKAALEIDERVVDQIH